MTLTKILEEAWNSHCYEENAFPRSMGFPNQEPIADRSTYIENLWRYSGLTDCFVGVYPTSCIKRSADKKSSIVKANKIYIDIDDENNLPNAFLIKNKLCDALLKNYDCRPRVYFSGMKGFAIYVDFEPLELDNFRETTRTFVKTLIVDAGLAKETKFLETQYKFVDWSVVGNSTRISRIPYTVHMKTNLLCVPIDHRWSLETVLAYATGCIPKPIEIRNENTVSEMLKLMDSRIEKPEPFEPIKQSSSARVELDNLLRFAPYISDGRHRIVYTMLIPLLVNLGKNDSEIQEFCRAFINASGEEYDHTWNNYVNSQIRNKRRNAVTWSYSAFFNHYPDLYSIFKNAERRVNGR